MPDDTRPKPFAFILMPFEKKFDDVYKLGIKQACDNAGAYAERVDDQIFQESILQRVYNQIAKADIIIADMTGRNPNVFYETGYAHALGKHVILLTQKADDIPFDLKHYPHIVYGGQITELIPKLQKRVRWAIEHPTGAAARQQPPVEFYISGTQLSDCPAITVCADDTRGVHEIRLAFGARNRDDTRIQVADFQIALFTSSRFSSSSETETPARITPVRQPDGSFVHMRKDYFSILPGAWESFYWSLPCFNNWLPPGEEEDIILRMFTEQGGFDYPFKIKVVAGEPKKPQ
ncbi:MAG: hypothetical protein ACYTEL_22250 [Planctomycetota bacterium]